jgi:hypothetical protein
MKIAGIADRIRLIKPIHKFVIFLFIGSLIYNVSTNVNDYYKNRQATYSYELKDCQSKNVGRSDDTISCIKKLKSKDSEYFWSYTESMVSALTLIHVLIFPFYLILYNIFGFIFRGYKQKYKISEMSLAKKLIHLLGLIYFLLAVFCSYVFYNYISLHLKIPVTLFSSKARIYDDTASVSGVWVKDIYQNEDVTLKNVATYYGSKDEQYVLDSHLIECSRETMTCTHTEISVDPSGTPLTAYQSESRITEWKENYIKSEIDDECVVERYTFNAKDYSDDTDYSNAPDDTGILLRQKKDKPECSDRDVASGGYKLWDGTYLDLKLRANESGQVLKMIVRLVNM